MSQQWITVRLKREQAIALFLVTKYSTLNVECDGADLVLLTADEHISAFEGADRIKESLDRHPVKGGDACTG